VQFDGEVRVVDASSGETVGAAAACRVVDVS
jgi:hypothetical protein